MTAVYPIPQFSVTRESTRQRKTRRSCPEISTSVSVIQVTDAVNEKSDKDPEDGGFCGESFADDGELLASLLPLLFSMKVLGLYFERRRQSAVDPERNPAGKRTARTRSAAVRVYATAILIVVWLNVIRFATVFNRSDQFGAKLLLKITLFSLFCLSAILLCKPHWKLLNRLNSRGRILHGRILRVTTVSLPSSQKTVQRYRSCQRCRSLFTLYAGLGAILQTAYYYANHTGKLLTILLTLPVTRECVESTRRAVIRLTVFMSVSLFVDIAMGAYVFFIFYSSCCNCHSRSVCVFLCNFDIILADFLSLFLSFWWCSKCLCCHGFSLFWSFIIMIIYITFLRFTLFVLRVRCRQ